MENNLDKQYLELLGYVLEHGHSSDDRTGTGTIKSFGHTIKHNMQDGFPILTSKKVFTKGIIYELLWFLSGDRNMKLMVDNGVNIWVGDAYKAFMIKSGFKETELGWVGKMGGLNQDVSGWLTKEEFINKIKTDDEFSKKWGDLGRVYGVQWRKWKKHTENNIEYIDQVQNILDKLKTNPDDRRMIVTAWNPGEIDDQLLPPCHNMWQVFTRKLSTVERHKIAYKDKLPGAYRVTTNGLDFNEMDERLDELNIPKRAISLSFNMRSVDIPLGMPFDITSYGFLLSMIAQQVNMLPENLICNFGDTHIYKNQIESVKEQIQRKTHKLPQLQLNKKESLFDYKYDDFKLIDYVSEDKIFYPLSN